MHLHRGAVDVDRVGRGGIGEERLEPAAIGLRGGRIAKPIDEREQFRLDGGDGREWPDWQPGTNAAVAHVPPPPARACSTHRRRACRMRWSRIVNAAAVVAVAAARSLSEISLVYRD